MLALAKRIGGAVWAWLTSLSFWQLVSLGLALFAGLQTIRLGAEQRHAHKIETQLSKAAEKLNAISSKRDQQKQETAERIKIATITIHDAEGRAKRVEGAPMPGQCRSPKEVLDADL